MEKIEKKLVNVSNKLVHIENNQCNVMLGHKFWKQNWIIVPIIAIQLSDVRNNIS